MFKDTATWNCQALDLAKMSQNIKKAFKMSIITQKVNKTGGKINLPRIWRQPCKKMDPTWPYASSRAFYMPFRAMNPDPRISLGHQEVNCSQPTSGSLYPFDPACSTSSPSPSSLGEADQLDSQSPSQPSQSTAKKYDKWTNDQQRYLIQLWADKQDMINSKDSRNAWREIAEAINNKFKTNKTPAIRTVSSLPSTLPDRTLIFQQCQLNI